jgi:hypothetical protein
MSEAPQCQGHRVYCLRCSRRDDHLREHLDTGKIVRRGEGVKDGNLREGQKE